MRKVKYDTFFRQEIILSHKDINGGRPVDCHVGLKGWDLRPDCQVGHFGFNFFFRTPFGVKGKKYNTETDLKRAVHLRAESLGFKVHGWTNLLGLHSTEAKLKEIAS